jgi:hypothetical protein
MYHASFPRGNGGKGTARDRAAPTARACGRSPAHPAPQRGARTARAQDAGCRLRALARRPSPCEGRARHGAGDGQLMGRAARPSSTNQP